MTALALHTGLSIVAAAWGYMVASRVPYRPAWIWSGVATLVLVGYLCLLATSVFDSSPSTVRVIVGKVAATLMALAGVLCLVLFAAVSRGANRPVAARGTSAFAASRRDPLDEDSVIVADEPDDWELETRPSSHGKRAYSSDEAHGTVRDGSPARSSAEMPQPSPGPAVYRPEAPLSEAPPARSTAASPDRDGRAAPRRALPPDGDH